MHVHNARIDSVLREVPMTTVTFYRHAVAKVLAVIIAVTGSSSILAEPSHAVQTESIEVCATGCPYQSIQAAINAAAPGTTVRIGSGTYNESITLKSGVSLAGAGASATILHGDGSRPVITARHVPAGLRRAPRPTHGRRSGLANAPDTS